MARGVLSSGRGAVVVMEGHPGTSKTMLCAELVKELSSSQPKVCAPLCVCVLMHAKASGSGAVIVMEGVKDDDVHLQHTLLKLQCF